MPDRKECISGQVASLFDEALSVATCYITVFTFVKLFTK